MTRFFLACLLVLLASSPAFAARCRGGSCPVAPPAVTTTVVDLAVTTCGPEVCVPAVCDPAITVEACTNADSSASVKARRHPVRRLVAAPVRLAARVATAPVRLVGALLPRNRR